MHRSEHRAAAVVGTWLAVRPLFPPAWEMVVESEAGRLVTDAGVHAVEEVREFDIVAAPSRLRWQYRIPIVYTFGRETRICRSHCIVGATALGCGCRRSCS